MPCTRLVPPVLIALALTATAPACVWAQMPEGRLPGLGGEPPQVQPDAPVERPADGGDRSGEGGDRSEDRGSSGDQPGSSVPTEPDEEGAPTREGELANTGSEPGLVALSGAALLLAGTGLRLRTSDVSVG
ncbi:MAG TPA: hypothetical protein VGV36_06035 [Solirubrobacteraceae bacterium]|nr:hypothetical protein [Solirubrobacteraceae bacterium]